MKIQVGVNEKMKLYNVYRLCKKYINSFNIVNISRSKDISSYHVENWINQKNIFDTLRKIPALNTYASNCINAIPDTVCHLDTFNISNEVYTNYSNQKTILYKKMNDIIELYESLRLENDGDGLDIKLPPCEDLKEYISYLKDIDFIFSQCPYLQSDEAILKFGSVDVGSNWLKLTVAGAAVSIILTNTASLIDKAIILRSHYITVAQQEEMLKSQQIKNELSDEIKNTFQILKDTYLKSTIDQLEEDSNKQWNPEERDITKVTLEKLIVLLDKGCEIYASLDAPEEVQVLFPEIQGNLELSDNILQYLEDKKEIIE